MLERTAKSQPPGSGFNLSG